MRYIDYQWDLEPERILFDDELDIDKLNWKEGDYFVVKRINGKNTLVKLDPLVKFLKDGENV
jgi:hypothetical protein